MRSDTHTADALGFEASRVLSAGSGCSCQELVALTLIKWGIPPGCRAASG